MLKNFLGVKNFLTTFIIGAILGPLLLFLISNIIFYFKTGNIRSSYLNSEIYQFIKSDFDSRYEVSIVEDKIRTFGEPTIVAFGDDKNSKDFCPKLFTDKNLSLVSPMINIYEKRSDIFYKIFPFLPPYKKVFEFKPKLIGDGHAGSENLFIYKKDIFDIDNDGTKEIVARLMTATCGSSAEVFNFVFAPLGDKYQLIATFPDAAYFKELGELSSSEINEADIFKKAKESGWEPQPLFEEQEILNGKDKLKVKYASSDYFFEFKDLDDDKNFELAVAIPIWEIPPQGCFDENNEWSGECECHWCPHRWIIGVYRYRNGEYNIDNNFNSSLLLTTTEKYDFYDIHGYKQLPTNPFGVISPYYGLGFFTTENKVINFNFSERTTSKIWNIIEEHYKLQ